MSPEENKAFVRRFNDELDRGNFAIIDELVAPDAVFHFPGSPPLDRTSMKQLVGVFYTAFPDLRHTYEAQIAEGDSVATRQTWHATHGGDFQGIPPTGKRISVLAIVTDRIVNGRVVEHWASPDLMSLLQQLGAIPGPGQAGH